jgi:hypothetical protein
LSICDSRMLGTKPETAFCVDAEASVRAAATIVDPPSLEIVADEPKRRVSVEDRWAAGVAPRSVSQWLRPPQVQAGRCGTDRPAWAQADRRRGGSAFGRPDTSTASADHRAQATSPMSVFELAAIAARKAIPSVGSDLLDAAHSGVTVFQPIAARGARQLRSGRVRRVCEPGRRHGNVGILGGTNSAHKRRRLLAHLSRSR